MQVALIGCGNIGIKRVASLGACRLVVCADLDPARAARAANLRPGAEHTTDWIAAVSRPDIQIVLAAAIHKALPEIVLEAIRHGKHVLVEKPAGCRAADLDPLLEAVKGTGVRVRVGFNHRYHPALLKARTLVQEGVLGELMFLRARYGHGGRIGYDREWRADKSLSGGGELIDQGVHLIDLSRMFLGDFVTVDGFAHTYFWKMPVDDNGFLLLRTASEQVAFLHASCTEWKNLFSMEIYGKNAKIDIAGLGGSYGTEKVTLYRMLPEMGPPETTSWEYPMGDRSWDLEFREFLDDIRLGRNPVPGLADARAALAIVEKVYARSGL